MKNKKLVIALIALLSTSTILVACVVGYKAFQFLQDNKIEMSMDSEVEPAKENVVEEREDQAETVPVEETKQLEDVEDVARGEFKGEDLSKKAEGTSAVEVEKPADKKEENNIAQEKPRLDKKEITKNSDGSYSFSDSYIEAAKQIEGMDKFNDQEINEILNETGEYLVVISDESAEIFIKSTMKFHTPSGLSESNNGQLKVDTKPDPPVQNATPVEPEAPSKPANSGQQAVAVPDGQPAGTADAEIARILEENSKKTAADVGITDPNARMDWSDN